MDMNIVYISKKRKMQRIKCKSITHGRSHKHLKDTFSVSEFQRVNFKQNKLQCERSFKKKSQS